MVHSLKDQMQAAKLIQNIQIDATLNQLRVSDFQWFVITIREAIEKNLTVEFQYDTDTDTDTGLDIHKGKIKNAEINYVSNQPNPCTLSLEFENFSTNSTENYSYTFDATLVEENTNSVPNSFMKYYINNIDHSVVGFLISYK